MDPIDSQSIPGSKPVADRISLWVGVAGSIVTVALTIFNAQTKNRIDQREESLRELETQLKQRSAAIEESKERVERYKWVLTLLPSLTDTDGSKRNFTVALVRLALTNDEAKQLFAGLQLSSDQGVRKAAQEGFVSIENQEVSRLVLQMNAVSPEDRKAAVAALEHEFAASPVAVSLALDLLEPVRISSISPSGIINVLYFLSSTDEQAWTKATADRAREAMVRVNARNAGPQTSASIARLAELIKRLP
jgi:hypothetical protein